MEKIIYKIFFDVVEKSRKCKNLYETSSLIKEAVQKMKQDGLINKVEDEEQQEKAFLAYCISRYGKEKSRFSAIDRDGIEFRCGNVLYDGKIFFVVSANGKIVECMEIDTNQ